MKIIQNEKYFTYLKLITVNFLSQKGKVISYIILLFGFGLYGYENSFEAMCEMLLFIATMISLAFMLKEIFLAMIFQKIIKNDFITQSVIFLILVTIDIFILSNNLKYSCLLAGSILAVPIILFSILKKIS